MDIDRRPALDPGNAFEQTCWSILRRRYPPEKLVYIPAEMGGDAGIEGYSTDGIAYQCYADRDSLTLRNRTDKQKGKLYDDTVKLKKYASRLEELLNGLILEHYFLMVPEFHAAELVSYAHSRAAVVREYGLSFISPTFAIHIKTLHDYPSELRAALADGAAKAAVPPPLVNATEVGLFPSDKPHLVTVLERKLAVLKASTPEAGVRALRDRFIRAFLQKEGVMASLRDWPDTWEAVELRRQLREEYLEIESELSPDDPSSRMLSLIKSYQADLEAHVSGIREPDAQRIALGQVGDWLMRCPLDFRAASRVRLIRSI
ncbi:hypothetical protein [Microtetraspora malaysiensis]|uniref:hypothetical protein n=1 Tax=Microtetraspora malaysiensis TaxID=161358 RepID=UPI000A7CE02F|nr:hypothetical protein [Microtetraspora malaysiensis]